MSKQQHLLDSFFKSLLPTIGSRARVYAVTGKLKIPRDERVIRLNMDRFEPNKYFNIVSKTLDRDDHIGIVNDDILFSNGWLDDMLEKLERYDCVSPGFIEGRDEDLFHKRVKETRGNVGVNEGIFDAFYIFSNKVVNTLGKFDEDIIEWYDLDWYVRMLDAGIKPVVSKKTTVMHLKRMTFGLMEPDKKKIRSEILAKHGASGLNKMKQSWKIREKYQ